MKFTVCVAFDGVLNNYDHYDENDLSTPRQGAKEFLETLSKNHKVVILTARNFAKVLNSFNGDYEDTLAKLEYFEPYWK